MKKEIPLADQARIKKFLAAEPKPDGSKPKAKDRRQAESLESGKLLTPQEAIALAISQGAEILYGGKHCHIQFNGQKMGISLRPQQKTLDPGICSDLKKFLGLK